jgi:replication-associated recombination protein RarA
MSNEVFGRRLVVIGSEHIGEAEVGAAQVAMYGAQHGVEGFPRAG